MKRSAAGLAGCWWIFTLRPIRLSVTRLVSPVIRLPSITMLCSISELRTSTSLMIAVNGPMYASWICAFSPMMTGPRDHGIGNHRTRLDDHFALDTRGVIDGAVDLGVDLVEDQAVRLQHVFQPTGVLPPAVDDVRPHHQTSVDEILDRIGNLELVAEARLDPLDRVEHIGAKHVHADEREVTLRRPRLLDEPNHFVAVGFGDAVLFGIGHRSQEDLRRRLRRFELLDQRDDSLRKQVVAEIHHERTGLEKRLADEHRVRQAARLILWNVGDRHVPVRAVADRRFDFLVCVADHDADVTDAGRRERFDAVKEDRLVRNRDQLLRAGERERPEACAFPTAEDQSLHADA